MSRLAALATVVALTAAGPLCCGVAGAVTPPRVDPAATPQDTPPGPDEPLRMEHTCAVTGVLSGSDLAAPSPSQAFMNLPELWKSAGRGAGVAVALIDTGVSPSPRLPHLRGDGDYVAAPTAWPTATATARLWPASSAVRPRKATGSPG